MRHVSRWITETSGRTRAIVIATIFVIVGVVALIPVVANPRSSPREIVIVAREMAFYAAGSDVPNPTLTVRPGEELLVTVRNQEPGITHAFSVSSLGLSIERIRPGSTEQLLFRAPAKAGRYEYVCPPHAQMMRGVIVVTD